MGFLEKRNPATITGPFLGSEAIGDQWLNRRQLRSPLFTQLFHNVYTPAAMQITHELRCRGAACLAPATATITGCSAAAVYGFEFAAAYDPVEVIVAEQEKFTAKRGIHIRRCTLGPAEGVPWRGVQLAGPLRTTLDILCNTKLRRSLPRTVGYLDALLRAGFVDHDELELFLRRRHDPGIVRARRALALANPLAESVPESEVRVWLTLDGLEPKSQIEVHDAFGAFLGRLDLGYPECKLAVEYDGKWHATPEQAQYDARRRATLRAHGWEFVIITQEWLRDDPRGMVQAVRDARSRRLP